MQAKANGHTAFKHYSSGIGISVSNPSNGAHVVFTMAKEPGPDVEVKTVWPEDDDELDEEEEEEDALANALVNCDNLLALPVNS